MNDQGFRTTALHLLRNLVRSKKGMAGAVLAFIAISMAVLAPVLAPHSYSAQDAQSRFLPPAWLGGNPEYPLGTDNLGRDLASRMLYGARIAVGVGVLVVLFASFVGSILGALSGYSGGVLDILLMRLVDFQLSIPFMLLAILLMAVLGSGIVNVIGALTVGLWVNYARLARGETLKIREMEYVKAAKAIGVKDLRIVFTHIIPNLIPHVLVLATLDLAVVIISEAALSFLGIGVEPPTPSWGIMISDGRDFLWASPWLTLVPGSAITLTVLGMNLLGDWLRDWIDPTLVKI
jgi:ABC-type dipeptide/oligopeptide/nickel transport system permease subunit